MKNLKEREKSTTQVNKELKEQKQNIKFHLKGRPDLQMWYRYTKRETERDS